MHFNREINESSPRRNVLAELRDRLGEAITDLQSLVTNVAGAPSGDADGSMKKPNALHETQGSDAGKADANNALVRLVEPALLSDGEIASAVEHQIDLMTSIPIDAIKIVVNEGRVTLQGYAEWDFQCAAAANAVQYLSGVKELKNLIKLRTRSHPEGGAATEMSGPVRDASLRSKKEKA
jgi:osmotically-inducible protein OsmY